MKREYKKTTILYILLAFTICFFFSTTAYSAINGTLTVKGEAYARREADVRITDFRLATSNKATSSYEEFGKNHIVTEVDLLDSSSYITYYVEITNYGSVDVGIFDITGLPSVVNYSIEDYNLHDKICDDTGKCNNFAKKTLLITLTTTDSFAGSIQMNFDFRTYHTVTYTDIENKGYPTEVIDGGTLKIPFQEDLKRVQLLYNNREILFYKTVANGQTVTLSNITKDLEVKIKPQVARMVKGNIDEIGGEVCIGEECFYIISNDGSTVTMLSKMNITLDNNPVQSTTAGKTAFSSTNYWSSTTYPVYVYNSNSNLYNYVENYKNYLEGLGVELNDSRLITIEELESIGCSSSTYTCSKEKSWVYETDYWSGSAKSSTNLWRVYSGNSLHYNSYTNDYYGIRPVIEIDVSEIFIPLKPVIVSGNYNTVGSEITIGNEHFYVISSDSENVTLLSKMNIVENNQSGSAPTKIFSSSNYWGNVSAGTYIYDSRAEIYNYVENYKNSLVSQGAELEEVRLIKVEELVSLGCNKLSLSCSAAPKWVFATSYWTGSNYDDYYIWIVNNSGTLLYDAYNVGFEYGVRPVIVISKDYF